MPQHTVVFKFERSTKRTHLFKEVAEEGKELVGSLYVKQAAIEGDPAAATLEVTITQK